jgi:hypothetical protein
VASRRDCEETRERSKEMEMIIDLILTAIRRHKAILVDIST